MYGRHITCENSALRGSVPGVRSTHTSAPHKTPALIKCGSENSGEHVRDSSLSHVVLSDVSRLLRRSIII